jgi:hypothetical protein
VRCWVFALSRTRPRLCACPLMLAPPRRAARQHVRTRRGRGRCCAVRAWTCARVGVLVTPCSWHDFDPFGTRGIAAQRARHGVCVVLLVLVCVGVCSACQQAAPCLRAWPGVCQAAAPQAATAVPGDKRACLVCMYVCAHAPALCECECVCVCVCVCVRARTCPMSICVCARVCGGACQWRVVVTRPRGERGAARTVVSVVRTLCMRVLCVRLGVPGVCVMFCARHSAAGCSGARAAECSARADTHMLSAGSDAPGGDVCTVADKTRQHDIAIARHAAVMRFAWHDVQQQPADACARACVALPLGVGRAAVCSWRRWCCGVAARFVTDAFAVLCMCVPCGAPSQTRMWCECARARRTTGHHAVRVAQQRVLYMLSQCHSVGARASVRAPARLPSEP